MRKFAIMAFASFAAVTMLLSFSLPQANALIQRDFSIYDDSHTTASYGTSKVCGLHLCSYGEHAKWAVTMSMAQRGEIGNMAMNGNSMSMSNSMPMSNTYK